MKQAPLGPNGEARTHQRKDRVLRVVETFTSINGEVNFRHQGSIAFFIRLGGCNLKCSWCFGVKKGRRIPRIITASGTNKKITDVQVGDILMTYDDSGDKLVETTVDNILNREVSSWYQIKIENKLYFVTKEHPFFTKRGLVTAENLKVGDQILHSSPLQKISFSKMGNKNPMKIKEITQKSKDNTDYQKIGVKISNTIKKKQKEGTYIHGFDLLTEDEKKACRKKMSQSKIGNKNPNWNEEIHKTNYNLLKELCRERIINTCRKCNKSNIRCVPHHVDGNTNNDAFSNLFVECHSCHNKDHKRGYSFWRGKRSDGKELGIEAKNRMQALNGFEVQEIKYYDRSNFPPSTKPDFLKVWNFSCSPYNSYLIDYMWVHNCDTKHAQNAKDFPFYTIGSIIRDVPPVKDMPNITITGGEPLTQMDPLMDMIEILVKRGYYINIETNGSIPIPRIPHKFRSHVGWTIDIKMPSSAHYNYKSVENLPKDMCNNDWLKFVTAHAMDITQAKIYIKQHKLEEYNIAFSPVLVAGIQSRMFIQKFIDKQYGTGIISLQLHKMLGFK